MKSAISSNNHPMSKLQRIVLTAVTKGGLYKMINGSLVPFFRVQQQIARAA